MDYLSEQYPFHRKEIKRLSYRVCHREMPVFLYQLDYDCFCPIDRSVYRNEYYVDEDRRKREVEYFYPEQKMIRDSIALDIYAGPLADVYFKQFDAPDYLGHKDFERVPEDNPDLQKYESLFEYSSEECWDIRGNEKFEQIAEVRARESIEYEYDEEAFEPLFRCNETEVEKLIVPISYFMFRVRNQGYLLLVDRSSGHVVAGKEPTSLEESVELSPSKVYLIMRAGLFVMGFLLSALAVFYPVIGLWMAVYFIPIMIYAAYAWWVDRKELKMIFEQLCREMNLEEFSK